MRVLLFCFALCSVLLISSHIAMARPAPCKVAQLIAEEDRNDADEIDGGAGHHAMTIAIRNRSSEECLLEGVPTLILSGKASRPFTVRLCSICSDYLFDMQPVDKIMLKPNTSAWVVLGYEINDGGGTCRDAATVSLRLQNEVAALRIDMVRHGGAMRSCGKIDVTPFLSKPPVDGFLPQLH